MAQLRPLLCAKRGNVQEQRYRDTPYVSYYLGPWARDDAHRPRKEIATSVHELEREKERLRSNPDKLLVLFREMIQMCLWRAFIS